MRIRPIVALAALLIALSGCVDSSTGGADLSPPASETAPPPTVTVDTGSVEAQFVDEEAVPVAGATVVLVEPSLQSKTDEAGKAVFNELAPGKYKLLAEKLGYESVAKIVEVKAQEVTQARFVLAALEIGEEAFFTMVPLDGLVQCSVSFFTPLNPCGGVTGEDKDSWVFKVDRNHTFKEGIFELTWKATGPEPIGKHMELEVCDDLNREFLCTAGGTTSEYYEFSEGESPRVLRLTGMPKGTNEFLTGAGAMFGEAPLFQQRFTIYMTHCFYEECGEDYSALPPK